MARYSKPVTNNGVPVVGAKVLVIKPDGTPEILTSDQGALLVQPLTTNGRDLTFNVPDPGDIYTLQYRYGGKLVREDEEVIGDPPSLVGPPGDSAYQIWLDAGNVGSEADFLDSLKGSTSGGASGKFVP